MDESKKSKRKSDGTFEEGHSFANGRGRPQIPQDLKEARKYTRQDVERVANKLIGLPLKDLNEFCKQDITVLEGLIASVLAKAIHQGDAQRLDYVLSILRLKPRVDALGEDDKPNIHKQVVDMIQQIEHKNGDKKEGE